MSKARAILEAGIETVADTTVISGAAMCIYKFREAGGWIGISPSIATAVFCAAARYMAETRKDCSQLEPGTSRWQHILRDSTSPIAIMGVAQLLLTLSIAHHAGQADHKWFEINDEVLKRSFVPLSCVVGNFVASKSVWQTLFRGAAQEVTIAAKNVGNVLKVATTHLLSRPNIWWGIALGVAAKDWRPAAVLGVAMLLETAQAIWRANQWHIESGRFAPFINGVMELNYIPTLVQGASCFMAGWIHMHAGRTRDAVSLDFYGASYLTYAAWQKAEGIIPAMRAIMRPMMRKSCSAGAAVVI